MSDGDDPRLEAVERRLADRARLAAPPGHRDRVLASVRDALAEKEKEKVPATKSGQSPQRVYPASPDLVAGTVITGIEAGGRAVLVAMALSAAAVVVAPWLAMARPATPVPTEPLIVARARAVGIDLPLAAVVVATAGPARESPARAGADDVFNARRIEVWRLRNLIEGEL